MDSNTAAVLKDVIEGTAKGVAIGICAVAAFLIGRRVAARRDDSEGDD